MLPNFSLVCLKIYFIQVNQREWKDNFFVGEEGRFQLKILYVSLLLRRAKRMLAEKML